MKPDDAVPESQTAVLSQLEGALLLAPNLPRHILSRHASRREQAVKILSGVSNTKKQAHY